MSSMLVRTSRTAELHQVSILDRILYLETLQHEKILGEKGILAYYPSANVNPYQSIIYSQLPQIDFKAIPLNREDLFNIENLSFTNTRSILHFHWLDSLSRSRFEDSEKSNRFKDSILLYKKYGGKVIYTLHNILPHSVNYVDKNQTDLCKEAIEMRRFIIEHSDSIQILNQETYQACSQYFDVPESKCSLIPHPLYTSSYVDKYTLESARDELCIPRDKVVILCFGSIDQRKGLDEVISALNDLDDITREKIALLIHGNVEPKSKDYFKQLIMDENLKGDIYISTVENSDDVVGLLFRASDYVLLNSRHNLNSGTAHLAITFEVPILSSGGLYVKPIEEACYLDKDMRKLLFSALAIRQSPDHYYKLKESTLMYKSKLEPLKVSLQFNESILKMYR